MVSGFTVHVGELQSLSQKANYKKICRVKTATERFSVALDATGIFSEFEITLNIL